MFLKLFFQTKDIYFSDIEIRCPPVRISIKRELVTVCNADRSKSPVPPVPRLPAKEGDRVRRIDRNLYKYAAEAIRGYPSDAVRREVLREFLTAPDGGDFGARERRAGSRIAPQEAAFDRMWKSAEYRRLTLRISCMKKLRGLLTNEESRLLDMVHEELTWQQIAAAMDIAVDTCNGKKWPKIVIKAARLLFGDLV